MQQRFFMDLGDRSGIRVRKMDLGVSIRLIGKKSTGTEYTVE